MVMGLLKDCALLLSGSLARGVVWASGKRSAGWTDWTKPAALVVPASTLAGHAEIRTNIRSQSTTKCLVARATDI